MSRCKQDMLDRGATVVPRTCPVHGLRPCRPKVEHPMPINGGSLALLASIAGQKVYVAGPMRGIPEFNFPAFHEAAALLRKIGCTVFNPAERDNERHGTDISKGNLTGDEAQAAADHNFDLRVALADDLNFICREANAVALLPGWQNSKGAKAERATADALGLTIVEL